MTVTVTSTTPLPLYRDAVRDTPRIRCAIVAHAAHLDTFQTQPERQSERERDEASVKKTKKN